MSISPGASPVLTDVASSWPERIAWWAMAPERPPCDCSRAWAGHFRSRATQIPRGAGYVLDCRESLPWFSVLRKRATDFWPRRCARRSYLKRWHPSSSCSARLEACQRRSAGALPRPGADRSWAGGVGDEPFSPGLVLALRAPPELFRPPWGTGPGAGDAPTRDALALHAQVYRLSSGRLAA